MNLRHRIRRIEDKLNAAVEADGEQLPPVDIVHEYVVPLLDADGNNIYGGQLRESASATVSFNGQTVLYDRRDGETWQDFKVRAFASTPRGRFARVFTPCSREAKGA